MSTSSSKEDISASSTTLEVGTLCSSCDRCRTRKAKCDGLRPCSACKSNFLKKRNLVQYDGIHDDEVDCTYSQAKKRGPTPGQKWSSPSECGRSLSPPGGKRRNIVSNTSRKTPSKQNCKQDKMSDPSGSHARTAFARTSQRNNPGIFSGGGGSHLPLQMDHDAATVQKQILSSLGATGHYTAFATGGISRVSANEEIRGQDIMATASDSAKKQLGFIQELQRQQKIQTHQILQQYGYSQSTSTKVINQPNLMKQTVDRDAAFHSFIVHSGATNVVPPLLHLLNHTNHEGSYFRACYTLSFGNFFGLPPSQKYYEYFGHISLSTLPHSIPNKYDVATLQAVQFAELALGALASGDRLMMLSLTNASVLCLQESIQEPFHRICNVKSAKTFFFLTILHCHLSDMERYFKYRKISIRILSKLNEMQICSDVKAISSAISFQDSLFYVPHITSFYIPDRNSNLNHDLGPSDDMIIKNFDTDRIDSKRMDHAFIESPPPALTNPSAPLKSCLLDVLTSVIKSCCGDTLSQKSKTPLRSNHNEFSSHKRSFVDDVSEDESMSTEAVQDKNRRLRLFQKLTSASSLICKNNGSMSSSSSTFIGHSLLILALKVVLVRDLSESCDLQESEILDTVNVLKIIVERPILLFQGGPTYHFVHECAFFMTHCINKLCKGGLKNNELFHEALDVYNASRVVLNMHRDKLPAKLQCQSIPRPKMHSNDKEEDPMIDMLWIPSKTISQHDGVILSGGAVPKESNCIESSLEDELDRNDRALLATLNGFITNSA